MLLSAQAIAALSSAVLISAIIYLPRRLNTHRGWYSDNNVPYPPHDWLWGHVKLVGEYSSKIPGSHFHLPGLYYLDMWPFGPEFIMCTGPEAAALATTARPFPQADVVADYFHSVGMGSFIEATEGPLWKQLHQIFAPGLTPAATKTYTPFICDGAERLYSRVCEIAASGKVVNINIELSRYPFSVVWRVFFGQASQPPEIYDILRRPTAVGPAVTYLNPITAYLRRRERLGMIRQLETEIAKAARVRFEELKALKTPPTRTTATGLLDRMLLDHLQAGRPLDDQFMKLICENGIGMLAAGFTTTTDTLSYALMLLSVFPSALQKLREEHNRVFPPDIAGTLQLLGSESGSSTKWLPYNAAVIQETLRLFPVGMIVRAPPKWMTSFELGGRTYPVKPNHYFGIMAYSMHYDSEIFSSPSAFRLERFLDVDDSENDSNDDSSSDANFNASSNSTSTSNTNSGSNSNSNLNSNINRNSNSSSSSRASTPNSNTDSSSNPDININPNSNSAPLTAPIPTLDLNPPQTHNNNDKNNNTNKTKANNNKPKHPKHLKAAYRPFEHGPRQCLGQTLATSELLVALVVLSRHFDFTLTNYNPVATPRLTHTDLDTKLGDHAFQGSRLSAGANGEVLMLISRRIACS